MQQLHTRTSLTVAFLYACSQSTLFAKTEVKAAIMDGMVVHVPDEGLQTFLAPETHLPFVPCNLTRRREFEMTHVTDEDRELNRLFRLKVKRILSKASLLLDSLSIPFWLSSGTLLGFYRSVSKQATSWLPCPHSPSFLYFLQPQCDVIHYGKDVVRPIPLTRLCLS